MAKLGGVGSSDSNRRSIATAVGLSISMAERSGGWRNLRSEDINRGRPNMAMVNAIIFQALFFGLSAEGRKKGGSLGPTDRYKSAGSGARPRLPGGKF